MWVEVGAMGAAQPRRRTALRHPYAAANWQAVMKVIAGIQRRVRLPDNRSGRECRDVWDRQDSSCLDGDYHQRSTHRPETTGEKQQNNKQ